MNNLYRDLQEFLIWFTELMIVSCSLQNINSDFLTNRNLPTHDNMSLLKFFAIVSILSTNRLSLNMQWKFYLWIVKEKFGEIPLEIEDIWGGTESQWSWWRIRIPVSQLKHKSLIYGSLRKKVKIKSTEKFTTWLGRQSISVEYF